jgi:hypothetical protein
MSFLNTGYNKAALVIGINYQGHSKGELRGCINDTTKIVNFLKTRCGFTDENIILLTDDTPNQPTRENIINGFNELLSKSKDCKELWLSYSGHGAYLISDNDDNESDNQDEVLIPLDYKTSGVIRDDVIYNTLIKQIPTDCKLFSLIDACHSGTSLDLPYVYRVDTGIQPNRKDENLCDILKISGCRDNQQSADAYINGKFQGALTFAFIKTMDDFNYNFTSKQIVTRVKNYLNENKYPQIPTLSLSKSSLLNELVMGDKDTKEHNININLRGDSWCKDESSWNLYSLKDNKNIFDTNRRFYINSEEVNFKLHLEDGNYILVFHDSYGDGGITGTIKYLKNNLLIKDLNFNSGSYKSIEFSVDNNASEEIIVDEEKDISITIKGDYYVKHESSFNIVNRLGSNIFPNDIKFDKSNETKVTSCKLNRGLYKLKCIDTYGDGGIEGFIKHGVNTLLAFNWNNLDWKENNGYLKYYEFEVI